MKLKRSRKTAAAITIGASVLAGGAAGAAFMSPLGVSAQTESSTTTVADTSVAQKPSAPVWVKTALDGLVKDGTLTQAQRDTVESTLDAARPAHRDGGPDGGAEGHGPGGRHGRGPGLEAASTALGMTADELRTELEGGSTIAKVAEAKSVDLQKVIDAIVADMSTHIDQGVTDGRMTQAEADARKADSVTRATAMVNGERPSVPRR